MTEVARRRIDLQKLIADEVEAGGRRLIKDAKGKMMAQSGPGLASSRSFLSLLFVEWCGGIGEVADFEGIALFDFDSGPQAADVPFG
jgi:hypothetical protein